MPQAMACGTVIEGLTPPQSRLSPPEQKVTPPERRCDSWQRVTKRSRIEVKVSKSSVNRFVTYTMLLFYNCPML